MNLQEYKTLPVGTSLTLDCPECGRQKKFSLTRTERGIVYHCYSASCGVKGFYPLEKPSLKELSIIKETIFKDKTVSLPKDFTLNHPYEMVVKLLTYGLTQDDAKKYKIGYSPFIDCWVYPLYYNEELFGVQYRPLFPREDMSKYWTKGKKKPYICVNTNKNKLVLTEDILSAIKVGKVTTSMALLGTELSIEHKEIIINGNFDEVIVWFDNDRGGDLGVKKTIEFLELTGIKYRIIKSRKDPKDAFYDEIINNIGE